MMIYPAAVLSPTPKAPVLAGITWLLALFGLFAAATGDGSVVIHDDNHPFDQCAQPYLNISDVWRSVTRDCGGGGCPTPGCSPPDGPTVNCSCRPGGPATGPCPQSHHRDKGGPGGHWMRDSAPGSCSGYSQATGVGGNRWYRFVGVAGDALPLSPPGVDHCGTSLAGWLSGWKGAATTPPQMFNVSGKYPAASEGVVERTVCFNHGPPNANTWCKFHSIVGAVRCESKSDDSGGGYFLFRLPYAGSCVGGYCAAFS